MTFQELRELYEEKGYGIAFAVVEDADLPDDESDALLEEIERLHEEAHRRWLNPRRRAAWAYDRHEF